MSRLKQLADRIDPTGHGPNFNNYADLLEAAALLRAAASETVGTEWGFIQHAWEHNADLHAARLAIADLKAERDEATKMAYMILPGDERNPGVTWREAYEILDEKALGEKHGHACAMSALAEQHNAALASLAEKQRAIDAAFATLDAGHGMLACREAAHTLRPHATKATEATNHSEPPKGSTPRQWTSTRPKVTSSYEKWWQTWMNGDKREHKIRDHGAFRAYWRDADWATDSLWLPWQEGDTRGNLPPLPTEATPATTQPTAVVTPVGSGTTQQVSPVGNDDTRELVARLALAVRNDAVERCNPELEAACDAIIAAARRGVGA